jgi:hypothetical protein
MGFHSTTKANPDLAVNWGRDIVSQGPHSSAKNHEMILSSMPDHFFSVKPRKNSSPLD